MSVRAALPRHWFCDECGIGVLFDADHVFERGGQMLCGVHLVWTLKWERRKSA